MINKISFKGTTITDIHKNEIKLIHEEGHTPNSVDEKLLNDILMLTPADIDPNMSNSNHLWLKAQLAPPKELSLKHNIFAIKSWEELGSGLRATTTRILGTSQDTSPELLKKAAKHFADLVSSAK